MLRKEKEIKDIEELNEILQRAIVCRIGLSHKDTPYVVPVFFGYHQGCLYFHSSPKGKKMEMIRANPMVCFQVETDVEVVPAENPCSWTARYRSVIGTGRAVVLQDPQEKANALNCIMRHYAGSESSFPEEKVKASAVVKVVIQEMRGKKSHF